MTLLPDTNSSLAARVRHIGRTLTAEHRRRQRFSGDRLLFRLRGQAPCRVAPSRTLRLRVCAADGADLEILGEAEDGTAILLDVIRLPGREILVRDSDSWRFLSIQCARRLQVDILCQTIEGSARDELDETPDDFAETDLVPVDVRVRYHVQADANHLYAALEAFRRVWPLTTSIHGRPRSMWGYPAGTQQFVHRQTGLRYGLALSLLASIVAVAALMYEVGQNVQLQRQLGAGSELETQAMRARTTREQLGLVLIQRALSNSDQDTTSNRGMGQFQDLSLKVPDLGTLPRQGRGAARIVRWLDDFSRDPIERLASQRTIRTELVDKGLSQMLVDAQGYVQVGAPNGSEEAVHLYQSVLGRLSADAINGLNQSTLTAARRAVALGLLEEASLRFQDLFADFLPSLDPAR